MTLSGGEHKALREWGNPEDRTLRDMSLSAGVMVKRGTQTKTLWKLSLSAGVIVRRGAQDQKIFGKSP